MLMLHCSVAINAFKVSLYERATKLGAESTGCQQSVAIKVLRKSRLRRVHLSAKRTALDDLMSEIQVMSFLAQHENPFIVQLREVRCTYPSEQ